MLSPDPSRPSSRPAAPEGSGEPGTGAHDVAPVEPLHAILDDPVAFDQMVDGLRERRSGFPDHRHPVASLLDALVWFFKLRAETSLLEATAKARRPMDEVVEEEHRLIDDELDRAHEALPAFEAGLRRARAAGNSEVTFDSQDPEQDRMAGALIAYLVATEFATVRTEELPGDRFRYHIAVDWPALDAFAARLTLPGLRDEE